MQVSRAALVGVLALSAAEPTRAQAPGDRLRMAVGNHFTVSFDGPEEETLAARALESLDRAYWRIGEALNTYPPTPVAVVLYTTQEFRDITRAPAWAAAAFDGTVRVPMRGAVAVGRLLANPGGVAVSNLLRDLGSGVSFDAAFARRIQRPFPEFAATLGGTN